MDLLKERRSLASDHPESVVTTWLLSFARVEERNPAAADLLRICAYLAPDAIPETILTRGADELGELLSPVVADPILFDQAIEPLRAYSLLKRDPQTRTLTVHHLVQAIVREQIGTGAPSLLWKERAIQAVLAAIPNVMNVAQWNACEQWLPHALLSATWIAQEQIHTPETALLLNQAGYYLKTRGRYSDAQRLYEQALAIREQVLGELHPSTATSLNNLAALHRAQGKYERPSRYTSERWGSGASVRRATSRSAQSLNNLALLYHAQGKYAQAEPLYEQALAIYEQVFGERNTLIHEQSEQITMNCYRRWVRKKEELAMTEKVDSLITLSHIS